MARVLSPEARAARVAFVIEQRAAGVGWAAIGAAYGMTAGAIYDWWGRGGGRPGTVGRKTGVVPQSAAETAERHCLRCRGLFASSGRGNRMCDPCRAEALNVSPLSPSPGGDPGRRVGRL